MAVFEGIEAVGVNYWSTIFGSSLNKLLDIYIFIYEGFLEVLCVQGMKVFKVFSKLTDTEAVFLHVSSQGRCVLWDML